MNLAKNLVSRKFFWFALIYLGLLVWSGVYRYLTPPADIPKTKTTAEIPSVNGDKILENNIRFAYRETNPKGSTSDIPVILVHGSPGSSDAFAGLTKLLKGRRTISVDLPGFGNSETDIPDYSIKAHAKYLIALMDHLEIKKAHFVGFSLGGGVILHLYDDAPERVESVSFVSSIGVQEYELLGNYWANRVVHTAQLGFFWFLKELTPHFGIFDGMAYSYARNFYDTDQRPLRKILETIDKPFQIIHGKDDPLVPVEAAREHARLTPHSEYHELDENHFFVFMRPKKISDVLQDFWRRVESAEAKTRATDDEKRIAKSKEPFKQKIFKAMGAIALVFFILLAILAFINEDLAFVLGGFFAAQGRFSLAFAIIALNIGSLACVIAAHLLGKFFAQKVSINIYGRPIKQAFANRKPFAFHFLDYFRNGKKRQSFVRSVFWFSLSAILFSILIVTLSYFVSLGLARLNIIEVHNTWAAVMVLFVFILSGIMYRLYQR